MVIWITIFSTLYNSAIFRCYCWWFRNPAPPGMFSQKPVVKHSWDFNYQLQLVFAGFLKHQQYLLVTSYKWSSPIDGPKYMGSPGGYVTPINSAKLGFFTVKAGTHFRIVSDPPARFAKFSDAKLWGLWRWGKQPGFSWGDTQRWGGDDIQGFVWNICHMTCL